MTSIALLPLAFMMAWAPVTAVPAPVAPPEPYDAPTDAAPPSPATPPAASGDVHSSPPAGRSSTPVTTLAPAPPAQPLSPVPASHWYGWKSMLVDAASVGLWTIDLAPAGALGLTFGAPFVHLAHGNYGRAAASLAARGTVTFLTLAAIERARPQCPTMDPGCSLADVVGRATDGVIIAGLVSSGLLFAILDDTVLAHERVPGTHESVRVTALVAPRPGGASLTLGGTF